MFTVPEKYTDDKHLELMLKELSSLIWRLFKVYETGTSPMAIRLPHFIIEVNYQVEKNWIVFLTHIPSEKFSLFFSATKDGFVFKNCSATSQSLPCSEEDITNLVLRLDLLTHLRDKAANVKASFLIGPHCNPPLGQDE